jgi:hexosaminidase
MQKDSKLFPLPLKSMKNLLIAFILCLFAASFASAQNCELNIIPQPKSVNCSSGSFKLNHKTKIAATDETGRRSAAALNDLLLKNYGFKLEYTDKPPQKNAVVFLPQQNSSSQSPESYGLNVSPQGVQIAGNEVGQFYAVQTLLQFLPVNFKSEAKIPAVQIADAPRFQYRGMHLDVSRHFMPVEFVKKYIDLMAQYKFNQFHWHLTDDQGWRIEIKKYPRLTEIGSRRKESHTGPYSPVFRGDGIPVEGFYTHEQIKDVVAYAKARKINVIPEIELPGHSSAALAAYPQFGCKENYEYKVQQTWGIFKEVFCPTDATFKFLEDVLEETIALFPDSPYIHIGGDEVLKDHWKESAFVQELKQRENLKDEHEVQSYFIRRIEKFVNSKGKRIIGWDEILEGGLAPNATVMSWRGERGGIAAAKAGHDVVMTPTDFLYFDYGQGDPKYEPLNIGNHVSLEKVYSYNPHPKELTEEEKKYILGAQANVWTEYIKTPDKVEYMVFPRMLALAETVWTPLEKKNFADFTRRLAYHFERLDRQNVNYRIPEPVGLKNVILSGENSARVELGTIVNGARIFYSLDGGEPTRVYEKPIELNLKPNETVELRTVVALPNGRRSVIYTATVTNRPRLKAVELKEKTAGVNLKFFKGEFKSVNDLDAAAPTETLESRSIQLPQFAAKTGDLKQPFGAIFEGYISVPENAIYEFQIEADDFAKLEIGGETVIDAATDGANGKTITKYGLAPLEKGFHKIRLRYVQAGANAILNLRWGVKGTGLRRIYGNELFR